MKKNILKNNIESYSFENFEKYNFIGHGFTTRNSGMSKKPFNSLNFGLNTGDEISNVNGNINLLVEGLNLNKRKIILTNQIHGDRIHIVKENDELIKEYKICKNTDGLVTTSDDFLLLSIYADCNPLFFADIKNKIVAVCHAGWKGTLLKFAKTTIEFLVKEFGSNPNDIIVGIGPSAGKCCYEMDSDVVDRFKESYKYYKKFIFPKKNGKYFVDLKLANKLSVMEALVPEKNIEISEICTICNEKFFSHRREKVTGRMAGYIYIK